MEFTIEGIHPQLHSMILNGQLSGRKVARLAELREVVERFATVAYIGAKEAEELEERYGAPPSFTTWGEYFQLETASRYHTHSDDNFDRLVDTIRFDLISAVEFFRGRPESLIEKIRNRTVELSAIAEEEWSSEDEEIFHLSILADYFTNLQLERCEISPEDQLWFRQLTAAAQSEIEAV